MLMNYLKKQTVNQLKISHTKRNQVNF